MRIRNDGIYYYRESIHKIFSEVTQTKNWKKWDWGTRIVFGKNGPRDKTASTNAQKERDLALLLKRKEPLWLRHNKPKNVFKKNNKGNHMLGFVDTNRDFNVSEI